MVACPFVHARLFEDLSRRRQTTVVQFLPAPFATPGSLTAMPRQYFAGSFDVLRPPYNLDGPMALSVSRFKAAGVPREAPYLHVLNVNQGGVNVRLSKEGFVELLGFIHAAMLL